MSTKEFFVHSVSCMAVCAILVFSAPTVSADVLSCVSPQIPNLTNTFQAMVSLFKEAVTTANATEQVLKGCFSSGQSATSQQTTTCVTLGSASLLPQIEDVISKAETLVPQMKSECDSIRNCFRPPTTAAPPAAAPAA